MNLNTTYLGLQLRSPLVASASPISAKIENIKRLEDAGAGAVVLYSLFEEQLRKERAERYQFLKDRTADYSGTLPFFPEPWEFNTDSDGYLEHIRLAKAAVDIPIIASLNGTSAGKWAKFAHQIEQAGADALELNLYTLPTDLNTPGYQIEQDSLDLVADICSSVQLPVAVKISPFFSNVANMAKQVAVLGASGLVLFNRFYQPDIDLEFLEIHPSILLSTPQALRLPLHWIAILYGRVHIDFAATSGIHRGDDAVKLILAGANVTMMASALLKHGIGHLQTVERELITWMDMYDFDSVEQMCGTLSQIHCSDPSQFERAQYARALINYPLGTNL